MPIPARLSIVTLGVDDVARSVAFYDALGWPRCDSSTEEIAWFRLAGSYLGVFAHGSLAADAQLPAEPRAPFGGITMAINVETEQGVLDGLDAAVAAGGSLLKAAERADWGGLSGYFADPDAHPWEIAWNPFFPIDDQGDIEIT
ncbi:MAG TPA: VOC family protein [Actinomycetota bacterium]